MTENHFHPHAMIVFSSTHFKYILFCFCVNVGFLFGFSVGKSHFVQPIFHSSITIIDFCFDIFICFVVRILFSMHIAFDFLS